MGSNKATPGDMVVHLGASRGTMTAVVVHLEGTEGAAVLAMRTAIQNGCVIEWKEVRCRVRRAGHEHRPHQLSASFALAGSNKVKYVRQHM
jgi:hypothetical protein